MENAVLIPLIEESASLNMEARDNERCVRVASEMRNRYLRTTNGRKVGRVFFQTEAKAKYADRRCQTTAPGHSPRTGEGDTLTHPN